MKINFYNIIISLSLSVIFLFGVYNEAYCKKAEAKKDKGNEVQLLEGLEYDKYFFEKKKDPIFAGILSWYVPGLGQYYCGETVKGTLFIVTEYALMIGSIFYFLNFDFAAGGGTGFKVSIDSRRSNLGFVETSRKNVFIGVLSFLFILHLYNVSDAVFSAKKFNSELEIKRFQIKNNYPFIEMSYENNERIYIGLRNRF